MIVLGGLPFLSSLTVFDSDFVRFLCKLNHRNGFHFSAGECCEFQTAGGEAFQRAGGPGTTEICSGSLGPG